MCDRVSCFPYLNPTAVVENKANPFTQSTSAFDDKGFKSMSPNAMSKSDDNASTNPFLSSNKSISTNKNPFLSDGMPGSKMTQSSSLNSNPFQSPLSSNNTQSSMSNLSSPFSNNTSSSVKNPTQAKIELVQKLENLLKKYFQSHNPANIQNASALAAKYGSHGKVGLQKLEKKLIKKYRAKLFNSGVEAFLGNGNASQGIE